MVIVSQSSLKSITTREVIDNLSFHVTMFGNTLILGVTLTYLLQNIHTSAHDPSEGEDEEARKLALSILSAKWVASCTLAIILFNLTKIALLNRSLDGPNTLKINNRYVRLLPRLVVAVVILCLPLAKRMDSITYLSVLSWLLIPLLAWEWVASLDSGGGLVEPRFFSRR